MFGRFSVRIHMIKMLTIIKYQVTRLFFSSSLGSVIWIRINGKQYDCAGIKVFANIKILIDCIHELAISCYVKYVMCRSVCIPYVGALLLYNSGNKDPSKSTPNPITPLGCVQNRIQLGGFGTVRVLMQLRSLMRKPVNNSRALAMWTRNTGVNDWVFHDKCSGFL